MAHPSDPRPGALSSSPADRGWKAPNYSTGRAKASQSLPTLVIDGQERPRLRFGGDTSGPPGSRCPGCGARRGDYHALMCPEEECPKCRGRLFYEGDCDCEYGFTEAGLRVFLSR